MRKKPGNYQDVDLLGFLDHHNVEYRETGKNVGQNWIGVDCPFCDESRKHCGINMDSKVFSCFVCGESGTLLKLASTLLDIPWREAKEELKPFGGFFKDYDKPELAQKVIFPTRMVDLTERSKNYLKGRNFDPDYLIKKHHLKETTMLSTLDIDGKSWNFKNRIIIPIIMNREVISYTARDISNVSNLRYKNGPTEAGIRPIAECLYNIDNARSSAILVEGPTDTWRLGDNSIGMMGVKFAVEQINALVRKRFKKIVILFDENAIKPAVALATTLGPFVSNISVFTLENKDPGSLSIEETAKLKHNLLGGHR